LHPPRRPPTASLLRGSPPQSAAPRAPRPAARSAARSAPRKRPTSTSLAARTRSLPAPARLHLRLPARAAGPLHWGLVPASPVAGGDASLCAGGPPRRALPARVHRGALRQRARPDNGRVSRGKCMQPKIQFHKSPPGEYLFASGSRVMAVVFAGKRNCCRRERHRQRFSAGGTAPASGTQENVTLTRHVGEHLHPVLSV
jgi:hypothetical protein